MIYDYEPLSEKDAMSARFQLMKDGNYDAIIETIEDRKSHSGNQMIDLGLIVYDENGKGHNVRDFLLFTNNMIWKTRHCASSAGLIKEFEEKKFSSELLKGKNVKVKITTEKGKEIPFDKLNGKALGSKYPDKNKVEDYISEEDLSPSASFIDPALNDEVPF